MNTMMRVPEYVRARQLYETITTATEQLALLARDELSNKEKVITVRGVAWKSRKTYASSFLGALPGVSTRKVVEVLAAAPTAPCKLSQVLTVALTDAVRVFGEAVEDRPAQFDKWARAQLEWPVLRALGASGKKDSFPILAEDLGLGADAGIKRNAPIDWESIANREVVKCLFEVKQLRAWAKQPGIGQPAAWVSAMAETQFPPLTKQPESLAFWFDHGCRPLLESRRVELLRTTLRQMRDRQRARKKTDAVAWAYFLKACSDSLEGIAPKG